MLDLNELMSLESELKNHFQDNLTQILIKLNRTDNLDAFLEMVGMEVEADNSFIPFKSGKIFVVGETELSEETLRGVGKACGIDSKRLEFCLGYEEAKKYNYGKIQWKPDYAVILVGPMPHSGNAKGSYSSIITALEKEAGYPPVYRMGTNELKITKSGFKSMINYLLQSQVII